VWNPQTRPRPSGCRESATASTDPSHYRVGPQCVPVWEFPLHGAWGNLAEWWWIGLVWTPRRAFPRIPSAGSWERSHCATEVGSYTPAQGEGRGLPRPRQIQSPPGVPWTLLIRPLNYSKLQSILTLINFYGENLFIIAKETNDPKIEGRPN